MTAHERTELLRLLLPLLGSTPTFPVRVSIRDAVGADGAELVFGRNELFRNSEISKSAPALAKGMVADDTPCMDAPGLRRIHRKLIEKATAEPIPTKKLIALAGYSPNTYSRDAVTHLCRLGFLDRTPDGVRLGRRRVAS